MQIYCWNRPASVHAISAFIPELLLRRLFHAGSNANDPSTLINYDTGGLRLLKFLETNKNEPFRIVII